MRERASELPPPAHTPDPAKARSPPPPPPLPGAILDLTDSLLRRLQDLEDYRIPQLAQCRGPVTFHEELAAGVRAELAGCKRDIEELKLEVDDLDRARERAAGGEHVKQVQQRLDGCTKLYRQAVVTSKRQIDASAHLLAREELFASVSGRGSPGPGSPGGSAQRGAGPNQTSDDALMSATSDVTEGLRRTLQLMQQEVDRSLVTNEMLQSQTQTMELTSTQYSTLSTLLHTSKTLITSLERADVLDRLLLFFAFAFFAAVCAYIFKKRVVDRGVRVVGGLGGLVAKVGGALAGLSKRQGAGVADVPSPSGVAEEASKVVRNEVMGEVARATAAAGAAVSAVWAGVEKVRERAFKPSQEAEVLEQDDREAFEDVPSREEEVEHVAVPVQTQPSPLVEPEGQEDEADDEFFDFAPDEPFEMPTPVDDPAFFDEPDSPVYAAPLESFSDEALVSSSAPPLPAESTTVDIPSSATSTPSAAPEADSPQPAARLPLDEVPEPSEGRGLFERGDADAHSAPSVPGADGDEFEPVFLREEHPPQPTMEHVEDVFDGGETEEAPEEAEEAELMEAEEELGVAGDAAETAETGEEDKVFDRSQYEPFRPTRPDLDEQLGDINRIIEDNAVPPAATTDEPVADVLPSASLSSLDIPESTTIPTPSSIPDLDTGIDLPIDYSDIDESAAPLHPVRVPLDEPAPSNPEHVAIIHDAEEAEEPRDVAGVEGITVPLDADEVHIGTVPPLDVEESGGDPLAVEDEAGFEHQTELPIDLAAEQTLWDADEHDTPDIGEASAPSEPPQPAEEPYVEEEQASEEELLEQMLDQQMGYGGGVGAIAAANASLPVEQAAEEPAASEAASEETVEPVAAQGGAEEAEEQEEADVDVAADASDSAPLGETEEAFAEQAEPLDMTSEPSAAIAAEEPTAAKTVEPTSTPVDEPSATPDPPAPTSTDDIEPDVVEEPVDNDVEEAAPAAPLPEAEPAATATPTATPDEQPAESSKEGGEGGEVEEAEYAELEADEHIDGEASSVNDPAPETPGEPVGVPDAPTATPFPPSEPEIVETMVTPSPSIPEPAASTVHLVTPTPTVESVAAAPVETVSSVIDSSAAEEPEQAGVVGSDEEEEEEPAHPFDSTDEPHSAKDSQEQLEAEDASIGEEPLADDEFAEEFEAAEEGEEYADEDGAFDELDGDEDMEAFEAPRDEL